MREDGPVFESAHGALVFAFNFSGGHERPLMNRLAAPAQSKGLGLAGLDGAAQAGMVRAEVAALGRLSEAILVARFAPRSLPCHCRSACCVGRRPNREWVDAIGYLADHVRTTALAGCTANGILRREYVVRYFTPRDARGSIDALAERHGVARNTVSAHAGKVVALLGGGRSSTAPGLETVAMDAIETRLREIGMVGG
jgi:hypothetical protein